MILDVPDLDKAVVADLRAFIVVLSHMPLEAQGDILGQATKQISAVLARGRDSLTHSEGTREA